MSYAPLFLKDIGLYFPSKTCFEGLTTYIHPGRHIAIMGQNGSGKSTLLKIIQGLFEPSQGEVFQNCTFGYVPQVIEDFATLSGGQRFQAALTSALAQAPDVLCLDEPTNHLDLAHRKKLMHLLKNFSGTLIMVTHDVELLRCMADEIWHIYDGRVHIIKAGYDAYQTELAKKRAHIESELLKLERDKKQAHMDLMREQERAKKSKTHGEKKYDGDKLALRSAQGRGQMTSNKKKGQIREDKNEALEKRANLYVPEILKPKFSLNHSISPNRTLVSITQGACGYNDFILSDLHLQIGGQDRIAIMGDNGSGKTTLIRAIMSDPEIKMTGNWVRPSLSDIGYLDQHYKMVPPDRSALDILQAYVSSWSHAQCRSHLNDFLFRKNEEVNATHKTLSGGEKARLCLALIAASTPKILVLDELTNNLDLETRSHVIQVLNAYQGAMIVISHDADFLSQIGITHFYDIKDGGCADGFS